MCIRDRSTQSTWEMQTISLKRKMIDGLLVGEKERFCELPSEMQCAVLEAQAEEIKSLRRRIAKRRNKSRLKSKIEENRKTRQKLKRISFELQEKVKDAEDSIKTIIKKELIPHSHCYNWAASMISKHLNAENIKVSTTKSRDEYMSGAANYCKLLLDPAISEETKQEAACSYLLMQTQLIKQINFQQFTTEQVEGEKDRKCILKMIILINYYSHHNNYCTVSYTHLTLPTNREV
eukprot:TRINITY_DN2260_c0_g1_i7.p1 TRINITY_DN2260_c0_g1~~TRINITY_DN2260_c0_g1_i7.p1  ORF type:complete len:235 (-),score=30.01 TRINITY_DN2260_c0_g1_i7:46-750(-)